jgi:prefoldin subunit 5
VVGVNPSAEKSLNAPERFERAFKDVPKEITKVFENADELYGELDALKRQVAAASQKAS